MVFLASKRLFIAYQYGDVLIEVAALFAKDVNASHVAGVFLYADAQGNEILALDADRRNGNVGGQLFINIRAVRSTRIFLSIPYWVEFAGQCGMVYRPRLSP
ncbi:MAG: hypothetical protein GX304_05320 [Clostridiales bacterium]|jgi:hypothetical protein|nr:hypothetical protein [Clostridiales bacterium]